MAERTPLAATRLSAAADVAETTAESESSDRDPLSSSTTSSDSECDSSSSVGGQDPDGDLDLDDYFSSIPLYMWDADGM